MQNADILSCDLVAFLVKNNITLATAESCTGGMIGARVTAVAGASAVYLGGVISYANSVKENLLGVGADTLSARGAVSVETAAEMAAGVRCLTGADIAVSVTGIAGPDGGSAEKPVGTVCFGIASADGVHAERVQFDPVLARDGIRSVAADHALSLVWECALRLRTANTDGGEAQ